MTTLRALAFLFAFAIDVRARASVAWQLPEASAPTQRPEGCLRADLTGPCAVASHANEKVTMSLSAGATVTLDENGAVARTSPGRVTLIDGALWLRAGNEESGRIVVDTEFGEIMVQGGGGSRGGEIWTWRAGGRIWVDVLSGLVSIRPRGSRDPFSLDPGMEVWLGPVGRQGYALSGFPRVLNFPVDLSRLARLFEGPKAAFERLARTTSDSWRSAIRSVASLDEERARARRASLSADERTRRVTCARRDRERRALRALYRRKLLE